LSQLKDERNALIVKAIFKMIRETAIGIEERYSKDTGVMVIDKDDKYIVVVISRF